jgi:hypothetical protein
MRIGSIARQIPNSIGNIILTKGSGFQKLRGGEYMRINLLQVPLSRIGFQKMGEKSYL